MQQFELILSGAPKWVFGLLAVLILLGIRRLKIREVSIFVALLPFTAFFVWTLSSVIRLVWFAGSAFAVSVFLAGTIMGVLSNKIIVEPRATRLPNHLVRLPATWIPLISYILVFTARFACGAWAEMNSSATITAMAVSIGISAAFTARLAASLPRA